MTAIMGFPLGTLYNITNISRSFPAVVTVESIALPNSFAIANSQVVTISKVRGMTQVNRNRYIILDFDPELQSFKIYDLNLNPVDTSFYPDYEGGGELNIISFPATATNPPGLMYNNQ